MSSILDHLLNIGGIKPKLPIVQGGMSVGISLSGLAAAVANEGGIGVIGTADIGMNESDFRNNFLEANMCSLLIYQRQVNSFNSLSKKLLMSLTWVM